MKISELFELYLSRRDLRPSSKNFKKRALKYFIEWFGDIDVRKVNGSIAEEYLTMLAVGRSKSAANGYLANFKPFFEWLYRNNRIPENPFYGLRLYRITRQKKETFTPNELSNILKCSSQIWRVRICFGLLGMRRGEMLNVRDCDIKLSNQAHVELCPKERTKTTWPYDLKNYASRPVALPEKMQFEDITVNLHADIRELMKQSWPYICLEEKYWLKMLKWQKENKPKFFEDVLDPTGNFQRMFRNLQKKAGLAKMKRFHELRAAFATKMIDRHGLSAAADALGHSNIQTTRRYNRKSEMVLVADMSQVAKNCYLS